MSFSVLTPRAARIPVVVEVPHAGLEIDALALATLHAPAHSIARDADLYVDELYSEAPALGAWLIVAHTSRYVCDLNRDIDDYDALAVEDGPTGPAPHGLIWHSTTGDVPALAHPLARSELERRVTEFYKPYHRALQSLLEQARSEFGHVVLLAAHSMASRGRDSGGVVRDRADVVPGTRGGTSAGPTIVAAPERLARSRGWSVTHDVPYRGGFTTGFYGRPREGVHALQVELSRRLYMDEQTLQKSASFPDVVAYCSDLVAALGKARPS